MSNPKVHSKWVEILDVNDRKYSFRTNIDVLNECFGAGRSNYMRAIFPQKRDEYYGEINTHEKFKVWMPKLYGNSSLWQNTVSEDGNTIYEIAEAERTEDWMDKRKHNLDSIRLVFLKPDPHKPYYFAGAFINGKMDHLHHSYIRIATKVRLIGNPVTQVELLDDFRKKPSDIDYQAIEKEVDELDNYVEDHNIEGFERAAIVKARINQSVFRDSLIKKYSKCCLCGANATELLVASHIKPWNSSNSKEKTDVNNGLLLCPNHDRLFDRGLITFDNTGKILISDKLDNNNRIFMNVNTDMRIELSENMRNYMRFHRDNIFGG